MSAHDASGYVWLVRLDELEPVPGVRHRTVRSGGLQLHVAEAGAGPPLLLVHGWPQHWWSWRRLIGPLAQRFRVLAVDLRGLGWSSVPAGPYDKRTLGADLAALLDAESIERARVVGHDWGGMAAFHLALDRPERVGRLATLDIPPPWISRPRRRQLAAPLFASYMYVLATPGLGERTLRAGGGFVRTLLRAGSGPGMRWSADELDAYTRVLRQPARARASSLYYRSFLTRELPAALRAGDRAAELQVPTLSLFGEASPLWRALGGRSSGRLRVETIPRAGHFLPEEAPDEVARRLERFLV